MTEVHPVLPAARGAIAAVVHVDGTGRLQTVDRDALPRLHALLGHFERHSGVPVLLNTSFNVAGEPIVCSPDDACRTFRLADLDAMVLGDLWIEKSEAPAPT
jgi:carbamoyltransferase